jgi:hypothetical protein
VAATPLAKFMSQRADFFRPFFILSVVFVLMVMELNDV